MLKQNPDDGGTGSRYACHMRMTLLRKLLLVWMVAWLPVSAVMASAMPISALSRASIPVADMGETAIATGASPSPCHGNTDSASPSAGGGCTHCVLCHLANALIAPSISDPPAQAPALNFVVTAQSPQTSFVPEPASPPPRAFAI